MTTERKSNSSAGVVKMINPVRIISNVKIILNITFGLYRFIYLEIFSGLFSVFIYITIEIINLIENESR